MAETPSCAHCGDPCPTLEFTRGDRVFCCQGCQTVYELLADNGLEQFYAMNPLAGKSQKNRPGTRWDFLNAPGIADKLLAFQDEDISVIELHLPAIHCASCIWLLENLHRLQPEVKHVTVNFPRRKARVTFAHKELSLADLAQLLTHIGYPPTISAGTPGAAAKRGNPLVTKLGIAAFGFGNIMIMALPEYLEAEEPALQALLPFFRYLSLALALPVVFYAASDYFKTAWAGIRSKHWNLDQPIALGILVIFLQSLWEVLSGTGSGYWDSLTGLVFFLLLGKWFQRKTYDALSFDREIESFFPLTATRISPNGEEVVPLHDLKPGDEIAVRNEELIPADALLMGGKAHIDNSFITGESRLVTREPGEKIFAGARQKGGRIQLKVIQTVSQSQLTALWAATGQKRAAKRLENMTDLYSRYFTPAILLIALGAAGIHAWLGTGLALWVATAVLIVACPCALALAAPFALGSALRSYGKRGLYLKNTEVIERMGEVSQVVFDKTGTLTQHGEAKPLFHPAGTTENLRPFIKGLALNSGHPLSKGIATSLQVTGVKPDSYREEPGQGVEGLFGEDVLRLGSATWCGLEDPEVTGTRVFVQWKGQPSGYFAFENSYRDGLKAVVKNLQGAFPVSVLTGDNDGERDQLEELFGREAELHFNQTPDSKYHYIKHLQEGGSRVMMVGDGLNDTGALAQSDVGVAVAEDASAFTPASDVIMDGNHLGKLMPALTYARQARQVVLWGFRISLAYNVLGLFFAVTGALAPVVCAILMPLSSITVVIFATASTQFLARKTLGFA